MRYSNNPLEYIFIIFRKHNIACRILTIMCLCFVLYICMRVGRAHEDVNKDLYIGVPIDESDFDLTFPYLAITELDQNTVGENITEINLNDYQDEILINTGGDYVLTGSFEGHILIEAKEQNIHIFLKNASITSEGGPAILLPDDFGDKLIITLVDGTDNTISDNGDFRNYDEYEAAIEASCDITFNGKGSLIVNGYYKDAILSKDIVKILDGEYTLKCKRNCIMGNDGVLIKGGDIQISSEKNGVKTSKRGGDGRGNIVISGGTLSIIAGRYSFVTAKANIYIYDCTIYNRSIVDIYDCGGIKSIQEGCIQ